MIGQRKDARHLAVLGGRTGGQLSMDRKHVPLKWGVSNGTYSMLKSEFDLESVKLVVDLVLPLISTVCCGVV